MDLHTKGHAGAACGVAGCTAVVATIRRAQRLQLEEPALLWELSVGICLQNPPGQGKRHLYWHLAMTPDLALMDAELSPEWAPSCWERQGAEGKILLEIPSRVYPPQSPSAGLYHNPSLSFCLLVPCGSNQSWPK